MTPAAELWAAVVKHCATGRGYGMTIQHHPKCGFTNTSNLRTVEVRASNGRWYVSDAPVGAEPFPTADEAVRAALRIVAPNTEPNVSC